MLRLRYFLISLILCIPQLAWADYLVVSRSATIKSDPVSDGDVLYEARAGLQLDLVADLQANGYYRVRVPRHDIDGWIYRTLVRRQRGSPEPTRTTRPESRDRRPSRAPRPTIPSGAVAGKLEVHVMDVGQADAILVRCPEGIHELLIDSGDLDLPIRYPGSSQQFKAYLSSHQAVDNEIEVVPASHPHADHIGNMAWVLTQYKVALYVDNGKTSNKGTLGAVKKARETQDVAYASAASDSLPDIDFCPRSEVSAQILRPVGWGTNPNPNNNSIIVRVDYADDSFLFVGDCEEDEEELLIDDPNVRSQLNCKFLKVGHHGSDMSSSDPFLQTVSASYHAVSCGAKGVGTNDGYKHPRFPRIQAMLTHAEARPDATVTLEAYEPTTKKWKPIQLDHTVYVTVADGDLVFESDGHGISRKQSP